jgi:carnitine O-palmitoyltransferase 2
MFSTRIPEKNIDRIQRGPQETRHALALYCGRFYKVELFDSNWNIKSQEEIFADFQAIQADGDARGFNKDSICPLSSAKRDFWAETREMLVKNGNKEALDDVDHSMICFTLDNYAYDDAGGCCSETYSGPGNGKIDINT